MSWRLRLHNRIVIPFVVVAIVTTSAAGWFVLMAVSQGFEARVSSQILNTASVVTRGGFATNALILQSVKAITGADVVTFMEGGQVLASTVKAPHEADVDAVIAARARLIGDTVEPKVLHMECDAPCLVAYERVAGRTDVWLAVIVEGAEVSAATRVVARTAMISGVLGLLALYGISQVVARRVTTPLERLVGFANAVTEMRAPGRAVEGDDEIGRLGRAFNEMIDRLDQSQAGLVRHEKLALAGMLAARVAHDIRNPLSAIKMQTQLVQAQLRGDANSEALVAAIIRNIGTVESVILDLIELARPGQLHIREVGVNSVVSDVVQQLTAQLSHQGIQVRTALSDTLPMLRLDASRFSQVLVNLIINAADAMPAGGCLEVFTGAAEDGSTVTVEVCDDGVGIDPAIAERVFEPFVSSKADGVGLGLVNAKAVVELHGGRITIGPRSPRGTRAAIVLKVGAV